MFKISIGYSSDSDTAEAIGDVIAQCLVKLGPNQPKAGILFNAGHKQHRTLVQAIMDTWPDMQLIGSGSESAVQGHRLTLMLLDSDDLEFHVGSGPKSSGSPALAAEQALSRSVADKLDILALCLTLPDDSADWPHSFSESLNKLLPPGTVSLEEVLPNDIDLKQEGVDCYYRGLDILQGSIPILLATTKESVVRSPGWSLTRHQGILRRNCGDQVYEYDTLIGERRRSSLRAM